MPDLSLTNIAKAYGLSTGILTWSDVSASRSDPTTPRARRTLFENDMATATCAYGWTYEEFSAKYAAMVEQVRLLGGSWAELSGEMPSRPTPDYYSYLQSLGGCGQVAAPGAVPGVSPGGGVTPTGTSVGLTQTGLPDWAYSFGLFAAVAVGAFFLFRRRAR